MRVTADHGERACQDLQGSPEAGTLWCTPIPWSRHKNQIGDVQDCSSIIKLVNSTQFCFFNLVTMYDVALGFLEACEKKKNDSV